MDGKCHVRKKSRAAAPPLSSLSLSHLLLDSTFCDGQQVSRITVFVNADVWNSHYSLSWVHCNKLLGSLKFGSGTNCALFSRIKYHSSNSCHPWPQESTQRSLYGSDPQSPCARVWMVLLRRRPRDNWGATKCTVRPALLALWAVVGTALTYIIPCMF